MLYFVLVILAKWYQDRVNLNGVAKG